MENNKIFFKTYSIGGEVKQDVVDIKRFRMSLEENVQLCKNLEDFGKEREHYQRKLAEMEKQLAIEKMSVVRTERKLKKEREEVH